MKFRESFLAQKNNFKFYVFSRWGEVLYEGNDQYEGWNGKKYNSEDECPMGQYSYRVEFVDLEGKPHYKIGAIYLIR